jgi:tetraacyldisaccharide 4'-kinase
MRIDRRQFLERQLYKARAGSPVYVFVLAAVSTVYKVLVQARSKLYGWGVLPTKRLPLKVVCVGNITMGGTGKTPMVEYIARALKRAGVRVAVLSRGYRGKQEKGLGVVSDGKALLLSQRESGDEPYLLARRLKEVPVLVGRNRYKSGEMARQRFETQVAILDDGYQHIQLERDMNILLVDGREGFGTGHVFPLGSLREPLAGLSRADHILITKTERKDRVQDIEKTLRRWNSGAEIFHGRTVPEYLLDPKTGQQNELTSLQGKKIFAFAGLATPEYFFELLRSLGAVLVGEIVFPDHHRYKEDDLDLIRKMIADAEWSVTTEKDMIRLEDLNYEGLPIKVLQIRTEISRQKAFEEALFAGLEIKRIVTSGQSAS